MATKKKLAKKSQLKKKETIVVMESTFDAKDTLFPEKVAEAKKALRQIDLTPLY